MDLTRRNLLRSAAVVSGAAAISPVVGSLSQAAVAGTGAAGTTLARTLQRGTPNAKGYAKVVIGAGEPHTVRTDLGIAAGADREDCRTPLLAFVQFSDTHVLDHQSPGRVEWLDRFEDPNPLGLNPGLLSSSYRPQEILTAQVMDAMVRAINDVGVGPVTGLPLAFMIETGDNSDNCQKNEIRWNIDILDGKTVRPDSGANGKYEGVMAKDALYYDTHYWHPDGTPVLRKDDQLRDRYGFPKVPGLLDAARQPFTAAGLDIEWYCCFGNHDGLIQGNFPNKTTQLSLLCTGPIKIITVPPGLSQSDVINALAEQKLDELIAALTLLPGVRVVTPDPARKALSRKQVVEEHFNTTASPGPVGHGFTAENRSKGTAYYYFDKGDFRFIVMDSVNPNGYADGSLDKPQFDWIKATIASATNKAVLLFSHHTSDTMSNPLVGTGGDFNLPRVLGAELTEYLVSQPRVIAWVNGHTHNNRITAHKRADGTGGFWEINTASHIDFPQQARLIEVVDNADDTLSIFTTIVDHAGAVDYAGDLSSTTSLAGLSRELSANDPQTDLAAHAGTPGTRNTELLVATPPELRGRACAVPVPEASQSGAGAAGLAAGIALAGAGLVTTVRARAGAEAFEPETVDA
jgi:metallophosphoesterase (TIGR03767 family)